MAGRVKTLLQLVVILTCLAVVILRIRKSTNVLVKPSETAEQFNASTAANIINSVLFPKKKLVIWSNDFHISPINDLKHLLEPLGVRFIDKSLSGHCHVTNTCEGKQTLRVINQGNAMHMDPALIPQFYESYKNDVELLSADAFACFLPPAMCELFEPFNRSLLVIVPTRYEAGRLPPDRWTRWNENLVRMSRDPRHVIGANNLYDAEYVRYFTGVQPLLIPSYCGYLPDVYAATRPGFILAPIHNGGFAGLFTKMRDESCKKVNCTVDLFPLRSRYPHYAYSDIAAHQGVVYVPYQVSVMSMFEQYRMNIPLFFPSVDLLAAWQHEHLIMNERTWDAVFGTRPSKSKISPHPTQAHLPDPNDENSVNAIRYWIKFSDFYQIPHITYYNSTDHLVQILESATPAELKRTSQLMSEYNVKSKAALVAQWTEILKTVAKYSPNGPH